MKKLSIIAVVVFSLGILLVACGRDSSSSKKTSVIPQPQKTQSPASKGDSSTQDQGKELDVSGKTCNESAQNVTSEDLTEAFVSTVCQFQKSRNIYIDRLLSPDKPLEGSIGFVSATVKESLDGSLADLQFEVALSDCSDCPRQFHGTSQFSKNPLGKWQIESGAHVSFTEDEDSKNAIISRHVKITLPESYSIRLQSGQGSFKLAVNVEGEPQEVFLQVQIDDGRIVEFESFKPRYQDFTNRGSTYDSRIETDVKVLGYSYRKDSFKPDWISLESK